MSSFLQTDKYKAAAIDLAREGGIPHPRLGMFMKANGFDQFLTTEENARRYLVGLCWKNGVVICPRCKTQSLYRIRRSRYRCIACKYDFGEFTGRWVGLFKLSCQELLWTIKLFELNTSVRSAAARIGMSYPTALRYYAIIRLAIAAHQGGSPEICAHSGTLPHLSGRELPAGKFRQLQTNEVPVYGITEREGRVQVHAVGEAACEHILQYRLAAIGQLVLTYTDQCKDYDFIVFCQDREPLRKNGMIIPLGEEFFNGLGGFLGHLGKTIITRHRVSKKTYPLHLLEIVFRYNHREHPLFPLIAALLCDFVA